MMNGGDEMKGRKVLDGRVVSSDSLDFRIQMQHAPLVASSSMIPLPQP